MANIIKPKRSESTGQTPTLSPGELAVNIVDKKVWVADSSGTPVLIVDGNATFNETDPIFSASAAFSITTTDVTNWNTAYGWGDHSAAGYLTTETDPTFTASAAYSITTTDIGNWNTAYGWGDHSAAGYLTTETDPVFSASIAAGITGTDTGNWNTAYGWGDHSAAGYLTTETDPVFSASIAAGITGTDTGNWNTAYGWGDHSAAGYLTTETDPVFTASDAASITATDISNWNAKPDTVTVTSTGSTITVTDNTVGGAVSFNVETPQGVATTDSPTFAGLTAAGLVYPTTDGTSGQVIVTDGAGNLSFATVGGGASALDDLTDVTITTVANDNILRYNSTSSQWENVAINTDGISEGSANLYYTDARTRSAISAGTGISFNSTTGVITNSSPDQTVVLTAGTGISTSGTYPSFTITNTAPDQTVKLTAGTGISTSGTYPNFTITNSSPDQTVILTAGTNISITGTYPSFTISASGGGSGTVTSITGGSYLTGGTITTTGTLAVDATSTNTASKVVARDASGNFAAGAITASSINKVTITAPATSATITVADGKTLTASNTLTFTGTDASSVAFGTGGTVLYSGGALGTPSSGTLTNCTFPTLNQNTTGSSGSCTGNSATATKSTNIIGGNSTTLLGSIPYQSNTDTTSLLSPNTTTTKKFLRQTGTGTNGAAPAWDTVTASDVGLGNVSNTAQVTSVTGTSPVTSSGGTTPAISLASGYGDTQNPYASKTANYVLAAPNGLAGVPTFRALVAADIPTLNQNTTGSSGSCTGNSATATKSTNLIGGNSTTLLGAIPYQSNTDATTLLGPNTTSTKKYLAQTGTGTNGAAPTWSQPAVTEISSSTAGGAVYSTASALAVTAAGTSGQVLRSNGSSAPTWEAQGLFSGGRLTLTSGTPVTTSDVTSASNVYYTPYNGDKISLYDTSSSSWVNCSFTEKTLALSGLSSGTLYDVFGYLSSGTLALDPPVAWSTTTSRSSAISFQNGIYVKTTDLSRRYLGTFRATSATTTEDSNSNRFVWNYNNRVNRMLLKQYVASSWTWSGTANVYRYLGNNSANSVAFVNGVQEDNIFIVAAAVSSGSGIQRQLAIGFDSEWSSTLAGNSTSQYEATAVQAEVSNESYQAFANRIAGLGYHVAYALELQNSTTTVSYFGGIEAGISGNWRC